MPRTADNGFDAAVVDRENHAVALVQVKAHPVERWATILPRQLAKFAERVAFVLTIDPNSHSVVQARGREPRGADCPPRHPASPPALRPRISRKASV